MKKQAMNVSVFGSVYTVSSADTGDEAAMKERRADETGAIIGIVGQVAEMHAEQARLDNEAKALRKEASERAKRAKAIRDAQIPSVLNGVKDFMLGCNSGQVSGSLLPGLSGGINANGEGIWNALSGGGVSLDSLTTGAGYDLDAGGDLFIG